MLNFPELNPPHSLIWKAAYRAGANADWLRLSLLLPLLVAERRALPSTVMALRDHIRAHPVLNNLFETGVLSRAEFCRLRPFIVAFVPPERYGDAITWLSERVESEPSLEVVIIDFDTFVFTIAKESTQVEFKLKFPPS